MFVQMYIWKVLCLKGSYGHLEITHVPSLQTENIKNREQGEDSIFVSNHIQQIANK